MKKKRKKKNRENAQDKSSTCRDPTDCHARFFLRYKILQENSIVEEKFPFKK